MGYVLEPRAGSIRTAKAIALASLLAPYLVDWLNSAEIMHIVVYAPVWVFVESPDYFFAGPTPMALLLFFYWLPYIAVAYLCHRYAYARIRRDRLYLGSVVLLTVLAVLMVLPMMASPRASSGGEDLYSTVIPLPITSFLAIVLAPLLRPRAVEAPWSEGTEKAPV
jgi:hypothetical protein